MWPGDLLDHLALRNCWAAANALLDDVGAKLLNGERADVTRKLPDDGIAETIVVKVQDVLDNLHPVHVSKEYT